MEDCKMKKFLKVGGYDQMIDIGNMDATCTCKFGSLFPNNFSEGEKICWHLKSAVNILKRQLEKKIK